MAVATDSSKPMTCRREPETPSLGRSITAGWSPTRAATPQDLDAHLNAALRLLRIGSPARSARDLRLRSSQASSGATCQVDRIASSAPSHGASEPPSGSQSWGCGEGRRGTGGRSGVLRCSASSSASTSPSPSPPASSSGRASASSPATWSTSSGTTSARCSIVRLLWFAFAVGSAWVLLGRLDEPETTDCPPSRTGLPPVDAFGHSDGPGPELPWGDTPLTPGPVEHHTHNPVDRLARRLPQPWRTIVDWIVTIAGAVAIVLLIKAFVVNPYRIPSSSMEPTLHCARPAQGCEARFSDRVLANRFIYHFRDPQRGEIVVFQTPPAAR